jgi:hypothetical protein
MPTTFTIGDYVAVESPDFTGSGRVIAFESGMFAVEHDDDNEVTWHTLEELESE